MPRAKIFQSPDLGEVRTRFEQWRQTRQGKTRIPEDLWCAAVELARHEGVGRTAVALRLDAGKLKRLTLASHLGGRKAKPPAFVEFLASGGIGKPEYRIELEGRNGTLRIHCPGVPVADVAALSRALWDVAR